MRSELMDIRQKAFDCFFRGWQKDNESAINEGKLSRKELAQVSAAVGWNAALDWAAKQIQGDTQ